MFWVTLFFAIALSLDGFGVGISYGMRKIQIPLKSLIVICLSSALAVFVSMMAGQLIANLINPHAAEIVGACSLILVGAWIMVHSWLQKTSMSKEKNETSQENTVLSFSIAPFGIVVQILKEPVKADFDRSGAISTNEAVFLGFALAMDALGAGIGASMAGFSAILTPILVAVSKFTLVSVGLYLGKYYVSEKISQDLALVPGGVILVLGLFKLIKF